MSCRLMDRCPGAAAAGEAGSSSGIVARRLCRGAGMMEFLVALLIFSVGMMALLSAQLVGKKALFEASQRSTATALVRDILERMRANPGQVLAYQASGIGDVANRLPRPEIDCGITACSAQQLAAFDLWQWESLLLGHAERDSTGYVGGLLTPRACIGGSGRDVEVTISWRGLLAVSPAAESDCGVDAEDEDDEHDAPQRHQLTVSTFLAGA